MAYSSVALAVVAAATSAYGAETSAQASSANASYQAQVAKNNQDIANVNAQQAGQAGEAKLQQQQLGTQQRMGAIKAAIASHGVDPNSGSEADVLQGQDEKEQADALTIRSNTAKEVYGYQTQGSNFAAEAGLLESESDQALTAGNIGAASSLLGGASSSAGMYKKFQLSGAIA
jgi:hypothetical protein